jgi:hypothetical protein
MKGPPENIWNAPRVDESLLQPTPCQLSFWSMTTLRISGRFN